MTTKTPVSIKKANGEVEPYKREKLELSLTRSGGEPATVKTVTDRIESQLYDGITTAEIYTQAFKLLKDISQPTAYHYSLREAVMELGPTGYPFEDFLAGLFESQGYEVATRVRLQGRCVEHEVDLYCRYPKNDKSFVIEAKFHNDHGTKTDLQVALSAKARFDDLAGGDHGSYVTPKEMWLVTNTKFSDQALKFGRCAELNMISWNYPDQNNLQQLFERSKLHPVTAITGLDDDQKSKLLKNGLVLCRHLLDQSSKLPSLGFSEDQQREVIAEAQQICNL